MRLPKSASADHSENRKSAGFAFTHLLRALKKALVALKAYDPRADKNFRFKAATVFAVTSLIIMGMTSTTVNVITVFDGSNVRVYDTHINKLDLFFSIQKIPVRPEDRVDMTWKGKNTGEISITRAFPVYLTVDGEKIEKWVVDGNVSDILKSTDIAIGPDDTVSLPLDTPVSENMEFKVSRVIFKKVTQNQTVPYQTESHPTITLPEGKTVTMKAGVNGEKEVTYEEKYVDGQLTQRKVIASRTMVLPVSKLVDTGIGKAKIANMKYSRMIQMSASAYSPDAAGMSPRVKFGLKTGYGVVAVDPNVIPLGTKLYIETSDGRTVYGTAVAADTGTGIGGNKIDVCFDTIAEARRWGRRNVNVYILE